MTKTKRERREEKRRRKKAKHKPILVGTHVDVEGDKRTIRFGGDPYVKSAIEQLSDRFVQEFGREPGPGDPVAWEVAYDENGNKVPRPITQGESEAAWESVLSAMEKRGTDPALIYAARKTGMLLVEGAERYWTADEYQAWNDAVEEYRMSEADEDSHEELS